MACYWEDLGFFFKKNCWNILENLQVPKVLKKVDAAVCETSNLVMTPHTYASLK